jgi:hypothetical protein
LWRILYVGWVWFGAAGRRRCSHSRLVELRAESAAMQQRTSRAVAVSCGSCLAKFPTVRHSLADSTAVLILLRRLEGGCRSLRQQATPCSVSLGQQSSAAVVCSHGHGWYELVRARTTAKTMLVQQLLCNRGRLCACTAAVTGAVPRTAVITQIHGSCTSSYLRASAA